MTIMSNDKYRAFIENPRELPSKRDVEERLQDSLEIYMPFPEEKVYTQALRVGLPGSFLSFRLPAWQSNS